MKKLRITQPGLYLTVEGVETQVPVGEVISIGGEIPSSFAGKYIEVGSDEEKALELGSTKPNKELSDAVAELEKVRAQHSAASQSLDDSNRIVVQLRADNEALKASNDTTVARVAELEKEVADLRSQLEEAKKPNNNNKR